MLSINNKTVGLCTKAIEYCGVDCEIGCIIEEASELIIAINKYTRNKDGVTEENRKHILEELVDNVMTAETSRIILGLDVVFVNHPKSVEFCEEVTNEIVKQLSENAFKWAEYRCCKDNGFDKAYLTKQYKALVTIFEIFEFSDEEYAEMFQLKTKKFELYIKSASSLKTV